MQEPPRGLFIDLKKDKERASIVSKALGSPVRLQILDLLSGGVYNVSEVAEALDLPFSTANLHINTLEKAGLLITEYKPASRGSQKLCASAFNSVTFQYPQAPPQEDVKRFELTTAVGAYTEAHVFPTCGMVSKEGYIGLIDDPLSFLEPERIKAQLLWFHHGFVEYTFPNRVPATALLEGLQVSLELCSEAPTHHADWPSDITLWVNGVTVGVWTSLADFGGRRGLLTPAWWSEHNSQYGLLKVWQVGRSGSLVDGMEVSKTKIEDLNIHDSSSIKVRLGVEENAKNRGGINIFGSAFGNYPQDIRLSLEYRD